MQWMSITTLVLALALLFCTVSAVTEVVDANVEDGVVVAQEEPAEEIFTFELEEPLVMSVNQLDAREFSDPGWQIHDTVNRDVDVLFSAPSGMRRGEVGTYTIVYRAFLRDNLEGTPLAVQERTVVVTDIDECELGLDDCGPHAFCTNTVGSYECTCEEGYRGDGRVCVDIDECAEGTYECSPNAECENTDGSYRCICKPGYEGDGKVCTDIDECARGIDDCHQFASCINTEGSFECVCNEGYDGDGRYCAPRNPCEPGSHDCHEYAHCIKHDTEEFGYDCSCMRGFEGDGHHCEDINECLRGTDDCPPHSTCKNTLGSYECECEEGYEMVSGVCRDIDECARGLDLCDENANCFNTDGGYLCECKEGFEGDGLECKSTKSPWFTIKGANPMSIPQFSAFKEPGVDIVDREDEEVNVRVHIPAQLDGVARECGTFEIGYTVSNQHNFKSTKTRDVTVTPTDQCKLDKSSPFAAKCDPYAICRYNARECDYTCQCPAGYEGDGRTCSDNVPPVIPGDIDEPFLRIHCIVCDTPIGTEPDLAEPVLVYAYDPTPTGGKLTVPLELETSIIEGNSTCLLHTYRATDLSGNVAERNVTVCSKEEDMRTIIMEMKEFYDWQIWIINVLLYTLATGVVIFLTWRFGATVGAVMKVFVIANLSPEENLEDYITAYTAIYTVLNPFSSSNEIKRKVYAKIDELMEG